VGRGKTIRIPYSVVHGNEWSSLRSIALATDVEMAVFNGQGESSEDTKFSLDIVKKIKIIPVSIAKKTKPTENNLFLTYKTLQDKIMKPKL
jgi:hypothetical protein